MTKATLILVIATLMTSSVFAQLDDVEIIDIDDTQSTIKTTTTRKPEQKKQPEKWVWSDEVLRDQKIVRMTNKLYDQEITNNPWLVVFLRDRHNETDFFNVYFSKQLIEIQQAREQVANLTGLRVAFVDIAEDGELLKETFDIDSIPSVRLVHDGLVYQMQWNNEHLWDQKDFLNFLQTYERQRSNFLRARVQEGFSLYKEYIAKYLANNYFDEILPQVIQGRKILREMTGYDFDFKTINKEFGKKKTAKKSQMRTIIEVFTVPAIVLVVLLSFVVALLILGCLWCCRQKPDKKAKKE